MPRNFRCERLIESPGDLQDEDRIEDVIHDEERELLSLSAFEKGRRASAPGQSSHSGLFGSIFWSRCAASEPRHCVWSNKIKV